MEIPRYVQFDFLMVVIGIGQIVLSFYLLPTLNNQFSLVVLLLLVISGALFFMFGFYEMLSNYTREKEIKSLEAELRKIELKNELNKYNELHKQQAQATLHKMRGKAPRKTTDEERAKTREFVFQEFEQKFKKP